MKEEIKTFLTAVMFYTRIPCPSWVDHSEEYLVKSRKYFPVIGWIVGGVSAAVYVASRLVFSTGVSVVLSMIAGVVLTGAFHEDGFADVCDAFGGGWDRNTILSILKDSRIGSYGAVGLFLLLGLKFALLVDLAKQESTTFVIALIAANSVSRFASLLVVRSYQYARDDDSAKTRPVVSRPLKGFEIAFAGMTGIAPLVLFGDGWIFAVLVPVYVTERFLGSYFKKWIGGYTGDCLGAVEQVCEIVIYATLLAVWKFS